MRSRLALIILTGIVVALLTAACGSGGAPGRTGPAAPDADTAEPVAADESAAEAETSSRSDEAATADSQEEPAASYVGGGAAEGYGAPTTSTNDAVTDEAAAEPADLNAIVAETDPSVGRELFLANGCSLCHGDNAQGLARLRGSAAGPDGVLAGGGIAGPKLAGINRTVYEVIGQLRTPRDVMPAFSVADVPDEDAARIYAFLQAEGERDVEQRAVDAQIGDPEVGRELFFANACNLCHGDDAQGLVGGSASAPSTLGRGQIPGPRIAGTHLTLAEEIEQYRDPLRNMMPFSAEDVPDEHVAHIYAWLQTLTWP